VARKATARQCRCDALETRLSRVEALARSNRKELDIQFQRLADLQALFDSPLMARRRDRDERISRKA
jgi:hypothetical protein